MNFLEEKVKNTYFNDSWLIEKECDEAVVRTW